MSMDASRRSLLNRGPIAVLLFLPAWLLASSRPQSGPPATTAQTEAAPNEKGLKGDIAHLLQLALELKKEVDKTDS
jgi:hypothetical protein